MLVNIRSIKRWDDGRIDLQFEETAIGIASMDVGEEAVEVTNPRRIVIPAETKKVEFRVTGQEAGSPGPAAGRS